MLRLHVTLVIAWTTVFHLGYSEALVRGERWCRSFASAATIDAAGSLEVVAQVYPNAREHVVVHAPCSKKCGVKTFPSSFGACPRATPYAQEPDSSSPLHPEPPPLPFQHSPPIPGSGQLQPLPGAPATTFTFTAARHHHLARGSGIILYWKFLPAALGVTAAACRHPSLHKPERKDHP